MNVRDLKLAIACGYESDDVKSLNKFFDDLFSGIKIYTKDTNPDLIYMKGDKFIMKQDSENEYLDCRYSNFWYVLETEYHCTTNEIQEIIQYKVEELFKMSLLTQPICTGIETNLVEKALKRGLLTPYYGNKQCLTK